MVSMVGHPKKWMSMPGSFCLGCKGRCSLNHCARQAFYEMPKSGLLAVAKEFGYEVDVAAGLPQILLQLCSQIHPNMSDEDKLNLVRKRMPGMGDIEQLLLESEEAKQLLDDKEVTELQKQAQRQQDAVEDFKEITSELAERVREKKQSKSASSNSGGGKALKKQRRYPAEVKLGQDITPAQLDAFVPLHCRFSIDRLDQSWRLSCHGKRFSRAWNLWGEVEAAKQLIAIAWARSIELGYETSCPFNNITL